MTVPNEKVIAPYLMFNGWKARRSKQNFNGVAALGTTYYQLQVAYHLIDEAYADTPGKHDLQKLLDESVQALGSAIEFLHESEKKAKELDGSLGMQCEHLPLNPLGSRGNQKQI